ncbi:hypothetical protein HJD18_08475 [Thermoleophilia bacterium SCSIO 60948]|nr:hypothetical protein HJD18_08475 [Thermoleophilia bacterium SCSIO 60948]
MRVDDWTDTRDTLHMWTQIVGKLRLANAPMVNHWWQTALYVSPRGLTTTAIPNGTGIFDAELDFVDHVLWFRTDDGDERVIDLEPKSVADFYGEVSEALAELEIDAPILPRPVEVPDATPFPEQTAPGAYDPEATNLFWRQLIQADRVMSAFRGHFIGKVSPVHFFWGAMDMAVTRFSGRDAPRHPGGAPNCGDWVMVEGYSHELSSAGFWPGGDGEGMFYAYAYPEPDGFQEHAITPSEAFYYAEGGQFVLPYEAVRTADDPDATLMGFLQTTYEAAAIHGNWDRDRLEDDPGRRASPR